MCSVAVLQSCPLVSGTRRDSPKLLSQEEAELNRRRGKSTLCCKSSSRLARCCRKVGCWWFYVGNKLSGWVQRRGLRLGQTFVELCPFHVKRYRFKSWCPLPLEWSPKTIKQSMKDARSPPRRSTRLSSLLSRSVCATDRRQGLGLSQRRPELTLKQGARKQTHQLTDCVVPPAP